MEYFVKSLWRLWGVADPKQYILYCHRLSWYSHVNAQRIGSAALSSADTRTSVTLEVLFGLFCVFSLISKQENVVDFV